MLSYGYFLNFGFTIYFQLPVKSYTSMEVIQMSDRAQM